MQNIYDYGSSVISTDLKHDFTSSNVKYTQIRSKFSVEVKVYCGRKLMVNAKYNFRNMSIDNAINNIFYQKLERSYTFHKGKNYFATFKVFNEVPVTRYKYVRTNTLISTVRRKYIVQERINFHV